ncbi:GTPase/DUF3482 domain-containing protein [Desulfomicrobium escambiense]|uniref:GTPase/DUF3482 domain-containing protein n=1 Tax=Desulfomicrobium escambiense TaxID=29503 RepID=UPI00041C2E19|nr:GTPase/DUF3482 domain-containing protein [Desulfomicrobium escambiense]
MSDMPVFAVIGHPNEGKSSVVATLVENDAIRVSPRPGETVEAKAYPVSIDGREVIAFVDTPGFQNPVQTLGWLRKYSGSESELLPAFLAEFADDPGMAHECELLTPVIAGAGIIYVLDASRPMRQVDKAEMEIMRLTGRPRMAILNCKTGEEEFLEEWKAELRRHFNMVRVFNALRATFAERLRLLESLRALEQDWEGALGRVVDAFARDWKRRNAECASLAVDFLRRVLTMSESAPLAEDEDRADKEAVLARRLEERIRAEEGRLHDQVCLQFRHDRRSFALPEQSVLREDLFSTTTWTVFGLSRTRLVAAAVAAGGAAGAALDLATLGHSLGIFAGVGGAAAGLAALFKGEGLVRGRLMGLGIGRRRVQVGPLGAVQWVYILLDRLLMHYWYVIHWSHAVRDKDFLPVPADGGKQGLTGTWDREARALCAEFFKAVRDGGTDRAMALEADLRRLLEGELDRMSRL